MTPRPPHGTGRPLTEYWQQQGLIAVVEYKGLPRYPLSKKLNVCWWFGNEMEQQLADAPWYRPEWPEWRRRFYWLYLRNPLQNFRAVVIGVRDKSFKVISRPPAWTIQRNDLSPPEIGWHWNVCYGGDLWVPRPFVSYSGSIVFYLGWNTFGFFGFKLNFREAPK